MVSALVAPLEDDRKVGVELFTRASGIEFVDFLIMMVSLGIRTLESKGYAARAQMSCWVVMPLSRSCSLMVGLFIGFLSL